MSMSIGVPVWLSARATVERHGEQQVAPLHGTRPGPHVERPHVDQDGDLGVKNRIGVLAAATWPMESLSSHGLVIGAGGEIDDAAVLRC